MSANSFSRPEPGHVTRITSDIRMIVAPNPSPMTWWGTNTYLVGHGQVAVIDPGPDDPAHLRAILAALAPGERISHVLVTHAHLDHSPLARVLAEETGAPVAGFGRARDGQSPVMADLMARGLTPEGEGIDHGFAPDLVLADGDVLAGPGWQIQAIHTPGHMANHLSFALGDIVFTGDHVMGWASSLISPPDGDLTQFMASCRRLARRRDRMFLPGHGAPVTDPAVRLDWLIGHREAREAEILAALGTDPQDIAALTARIYTDTPAALLPMARRNVFAHLIDLHGRGLVAARPDLGLSARYWLR